MRSNTTKSEECTEPDNDHRQTTGQFPEQRHEQVEPLALHFETRTADDTWLVVTTGNTEYTEKDLRNHYGPVRNVTELVSVEAVTEVLADAR